MSSHLSEDRITCPHCWHEFYGDQALYISENPKLFGDPVLGDVPSRFLPQEVKRDRNGRAMDPQGWREMTERACPRCHLQVPLELLDRDPRFISIVGAPRSGKTYFLTIMLYFLRKTLSSQFGCTLMMLDSHEKQVVSGNQKKVFGATDPNELIFLDKTQESGADMYNTVTLDEVSVQLPKPYLLSIRGNSEESRETMKNGHHCLVLYDNAGESYLLDRDEGSNRGTNRSTQHLRKSNSVLFAYDPLLEPETRVRLKSVSEDPQISSHATTSDQLELLTTTIHRIRRESDQQSNRRASQGRLSATLAVCVQKYDVWRSLVDHCRFEDGRQIIDPTSVDYLKEQGVAALDITEINIVSYIVRTLLMDISPEFVTTAEANFRKVRYFPVSALGKSPELMGELLAIRPVDVQPFRVDHPVLWLLREWKVIRGYRKKGDNPRKLPVATIKKVTPTRIDVVCPESRELFQLDHDYIGREFYNPNTLHFFWIPRLNPKQKKSATQPVEEQRTSSGDSRTGLPTQGRGLKLGDSAAKQNQATQKKKKKRGIWPFQ